MQTTRLPSARILLALAAGLVLLPGTALAGDARQGVKAKPGEIVLLRDVSARHAYRPVPPGIALMVNASPENEISQALDTGELSDDEYAAIGSGAGTGPAAMTTIERAVGSALGGPGSGSGAGIGTDTGITRSIGVSMGTVGDATRGIGDQIGGALSQLPSMSPPAAGTPGR